MARPLRLEKEQFIRATVRATAVILDPIIRLLTIPGALIPDNHTHAYRHRQTAIYRNDR